MMTVGKDCYPNKKPNRDEVKSSQPTHITFSTIANNNNNNNNSNSNTHNASCTSLNLHLELELDLGDTDADADADADAETDADVDTDTGRNIDLTHRDAGAGGGDAEEEDEEVDKEDTNNITYSTTRPIETILKKHADELDFNLAESSLRQRFPVGYQRQSCATPLDVLFLFYEKQEEQVYNRNMLATTPHFTVENVFSVISCSADEVLLNIQEFLSINEENHKMIVYVGHETGYCDLQCGHDTILTKVQLQEVICKFSKTEHLYLAFLTCTPDNFRNEAQQHIEFHSKLADTDSKSGDKLQVEIVWDRSLHPSRTTLTARKDFDIYRKLEYDVVAKYYFTHFF